MSDGHSDTDPKTHRQNVEVLEKFHGNCWYLEEKRGQGQKEGLQQKKMREAVWFGIKYRL